MKFFESLCLLMKLTRSWHLAKIFIFVEGGDSFATPIIRLSKTKRGIGLGSPMQFKEIKFIGLQAYNRPLFHEIRLNKRDSLSVTNLNSQHQLSWCSNIVSY